MNYITNVEEIKIRIKETDPAEIARVCGLATARKKEGGKDTYVCPNCRNGTGKDGTGICPQYTVSGWLWHCFRCSGSSGKGWDNLSLLGGYFGLNHNDNKEFIELLEESARALNITIDYADSGFHTRAYSKPTRKLLAPPKQNFSSPVEEKIRKDRTPFYQYVANNLPNFVKSQGGAWRSLTLDTLRKFNCGYHPNFCFVTIKDRKICAPVAVIPSSKYSFMTRLTCPLEALPQENQDFISPKKYSSGKKDVFNLRAAESVKDEVLILVEGAIDAMSGYQALGKDIFLALNGSSISYLVAEDFKKILPAKKFIVMLDNDEAGRINAQKIADKLIECGHLAITAFLPDKEKVKDMNDFLQVDVNGLRESLTKILEDAGAKFDALKQKLNAAAQILPVNVDSHEESNTPPPSRIEQLKKNLAVLNQKLADFETEKSAAIETIKNLSSFDTSTLFTPEILRAAAFTKLYDAQCFSELKTAISKGNKKDKFPLQLYNSEIKTCTDNLSAEFYQLKAKIASLCGKIHTLDFQSQEADLANYIFPAGYVIDAGGVRKIAGEKEILVCNRPVMITEIMRDSTGVQKVVLSQKSPRGWHHIIPVVRSTITNARQAVMLSDYGLDVTSSRASMFCDFMADSLALNEENLPVVYTVPQAGWHKFNGLEYFVDPRRDVFVTDDSGQFKVEVADSIKSVLTSAGTIEEWKKAYDLVRNCPIARFIVAACLAAPLLNTCGERNFVVYVRAGSRAGKSTALSLGAAAIGNEKYIVNFNSTGNALVGTAVARNDLAFLIDERQSAGKNVSDEFSNLIYLLADGREKNRLNRNGDRRELRQWRTIVVANGEQSLLPENIPAGGYTRVLNIQTTDVIIPSDSCEVIRSIIRDNYGVVFPAFVDAISTCRNKIKELKSIIQQQLKRKFPNYLDEHRRYVTLIALADCFLNQVLGVNDSQSVNDAMQMAFKIFDYIPFEKEFSDSEREERILLDFISRNSSCFEGYRNFNDKTPKIFGKLDGDYLFITVGTVKDCCRQNELDYVKTVDDLIASGFFVPADSIEKRYKSPRKFIKQRIGITSTWVYRIPTHKINET